MVIQWGGHILSRKEKAPLTNRLPGTHLSDAPLFDMQNCYDKFQKRGIDMASIVKRNKSFGVVYTSYEGKKQKQH
ncbi:hypothetical protein [Allofournierella sp. CML151]|jgi:hypothetical protein|uniref:hypothetical protein n=1 Tax=Allofournierella sp. CML151 TaxID=2998082 RepID=UPI0022EA81CD|nr:hypothetical protein [Fournierella sp. CML151]